MQTVSICPEPFEANLCDLPQGYMHAYAFPHDAATIAAVCAKVAPDCPLDDRPEIYHRTVKVNGCKSIVTNCKPITLEYVCFPSDEEIEDFPQEMRDALAYKVAETLFMVQGDNQNAEKYRVLAMDQVREAKETDDRQESRDPELTHGLLVESRQW